MSRGVVVSTCSPEDEVRGSVLRLGVLLDNLNHEEKWVYCPTFFKRGEKRLQGVSVRYFPCSWQDVFRAMVLFLKGLPATNALFQRKAIFLDLRKADICIFHLSRTFHKKPLSKNFCVDLCESLGQNFRNRACLLPRFSLKRFFFLYEAKRLERFERNLARDPAIPTQFISKNDPLIDDALNVSILPNSIKVIPQRRRPVITNSAKIVFVGQLDYEPNFYSVLRSCELINEIDPEYEVHLIGSAKKVTRRKLAALSNVVLHGFVEDMSDIISDALCGLAIIENGTGMQNKVLDYLYHGIPAIVSSEVFLGLPAGCPVLVADSKEKICEALEKCLSATFRSEQERKGLEYLKLLKGLNGEEHYRNG